MYEDPSCIAESRPTGYADCCNAPVPPSLPNKMREVTIQEVNSGYIVRVGCHTFAIETKETLVGKLTSYINNPDETEKRWFAGKL